MIDLNELATFLNLANKSTYADSSAPKANSLRPSSEDYHFEHGNLVYHDTYFGARDFLGEEVVYQSGVPVWGMNYYGHVLNADIATDDAYAILRPALMQDYDDIIPVRGPKEYTEGNSTYTNRAEGALDRFVGEEQIYLNGTLVYRGWYHGGLIA